MQHSLPTQVNCQYFLRNKPKRPMNKNTPVRMLAMLLERPLKAVSWCNCSWRQLPGKG